MDSPPKLSGETLIVHHIPLVHCQVSGRRQGGCGSSLKRSNPFSTPENLGLSRTTSLPERDVLQRDALLYSSLIQTSSGSWSSHNGGRERKGSARGCSTTSDDSSFTSSNSEDQLITAHTLPRAKQRSRNPLRHNPFLLNTEDDEEDEEEEDDGNNLSGYLEDSSFHLHSDTNSALDDGMTPFRLHDLDFASEPFLLHNSIGGSRRESLRGVVSGISNHLQDLDILDLDSQYRHGSSGSNMSMDCGEQDWGDDDEEDEDHPMKCGRSSKTGSYSSGSSTQHCSCCVLTQNYPQTFPEAYTEPFSECQQGYGSDSSSNSSYGVLVNFSAIYNKMNNGIPEKSPCSAPTNLNNSTDHSCTSSVSDPPGSQRGTTGGAFYLDLHTSPTEPPMSKQQPSSVCNTYSVIQEPHLSTSSTCSAQHQGALDLDANCNSYLPPHSGSSGDLASCLQSQARLVVATQNYYKLVTCDLSSQSSPSPAGSSANSCSDEHSKESPTPTQPREYFLFRQQAEEERVEEDDDDDDDDDRDSPKPTVESDDEDKETEEPEVGSEAGPARIKGQVYVNTSPPMTGSGGASTAGRPRSRSYDRNLDKSPSPRLGSLERMLSCPMRLSEGTVPVPPPPPRVTSFAEIARSKRKNTASGGSPSLKSAVDPFSSTYSHSSVEFSPIPEQNVETDGQSLSPLLFTRCHSQGSIEEHLEGARETWKKVEGGLSSSSDGHPTVFRYSKEQRPTTLPIQPFTLQHQFTFKPPQPKPVRPQLLDFVSGMQARSSSGSGSGDLAEDSAENPYQGGLSSSVTPRGLVRPSPLGSYSPVRLQGASSSAACSTCTPSPQPAHSPSCPLSAGQSPQHTSMEQGDGSMSMPLTPPPSSLGVKRGVVPPTLSALHTHCLYPGRLHSDTLSPLGGPEPGKHVDGGKGAAARTHNASHSAKLQQTYNDFLPDYFSMTEKPPEEFCLSPDISTSSTFCPSSPQPQISVDLLQKKGLVKAVNRAVDLIVAHFGTSRDPDVKAKLGNSWVSPNVGHLILKYLCPAMREVLQDGLKAYVLDLIIGQRRCQPWSLVEASTQLGPSTRVLHSLFSKVSQYSELTSHNMRLNAFIFGLLNLKSLEFWFSHLHTHEDIVAAHYSPWGFLPLSHGVCQPLFEELLLLLQPLSLLPFDLDVLFEPHLLQKGQEHLRRKEQLCSAGQSVDQTRRSTFQLMMGWSSTVREMVEREKPILRREGTWPRMEGARSKREVHGGASRREGATSESMIDVLDGRGTAGKVGSSHTWKDKGVEVQRAKVVGQEGREESNEVQEKDRRKDKDRQAGWWYQLMQSSQIYIDQSNEGSKFVKAEKRKKLLERRQGEAPPTREGVVEGAESSQEISSSSSGDLAGYRGRPSWMGSPPESVLNQDKETETKETLGAGAQAAAQDESPSQGQNLRWGRLFGSSVGSPVRTETVEQKTKAPKSRAPSGWLGMDRSVLNLVAHAIGSNGSRRDELPDSSPQSRSTAPTEMTRLASVERQPGHPSPCEVHALCHHIATEPGQLSFNKGDTLQVLSKADPDWLLCSMGSTQGLVPIIYVTLKSAEYSQDARE